MASSSHGCSQQKKESDNREDAVNMCLRVGNRTLVCALLLYVLAHSSYLLAGLCPWVYTRSCACVSMSVEACLCISVFLHICLSACTYVCICQCMHLLPGDSDLPCDRGTLCRDCSDLKASAHTTAFVFGYLFIIHGVPEMTGEGQLGELQPALAKGWGFLFLRLTLGTQPRLTHLFFGLICTEVLTGGPSLSITQVQDSPAVPASSYPFFLPSSFFWPHHLPQSLTSLSLPSQVETAVTAHFLRGIAWHPDMGLSLTSPYTQGLHV